MEPILELIRTERYNLAFKQLWENYKSAEKFEKGGIYADIESLLKNGYVNFILDQNLKIKICSELNLNDKIYLNPELPPQIGVAEFPAVEKDFATVLRLNAVEGDFGSSLKKFEDKIDYYYAYNKLGDDINENLVNADDNSKDTYVLNWGIGIELAQNVFGENKFGNGSQIKVKGSSYTFAAVAAFVSKLFNIPVPQNIIFTGSFDKNGRAKTINDLSKKLELIKAERPNAKSIIIPYKELFDNSTRKLIEDNKNLFVEINSITDLIKAVFNKKLTELCMLSPEKLHSLGSSRIRARFFDNAEYSFRNQIGEIKKLHKTLQIWEFQKNLLYDVFPVKKLSFENKKYPNADLILFDGPIPNIYTGFFMGHLLKQSSALFAIHDGKDNDKFIIFAHPKGDTSLVNWYLSWEEIKDLNAI